MGVGWSGSFKKNLILNDHPTPTPNPSPQGGGKKLCKYDSDKSRNPLNSRHAEQIEGIPAYAGMTRSERASSSHIAVALTL
jgi:hypothetical protein